MTVLMILLLGMTDLAIMWSWKRSLWYLWINRFLNGLVVLLLTRGLPNLYLSPSYTTLEIVCSRLRGWAHYTSAETTASQTWHSLGPHWDWGFNTWLFPVRDRIKVHSIHASVVNMVMNFTDWLRNSRSTDLWTGSGLSVHFLWCLYELTD